MAKKNAPKVKTINSQKTGVLKILFFLIFMIITLFMSANIYFVNKALPKTYINELDISGKTRNQIIRELEAKVNTPTKISIKIADTQIDLIPSEVGFLYNFNATADDAINSNKTNFKGLRLVSNPTNIFINKNLPLKFELREDKLSEFINIIDNNFSKQPTKYSIKLQNGEVVVNKGNVGSIIDQRDLKTKIISSFENNNQNLIYARFETINDTLNDSEEKQIKLRAGFLVNKSIEIIAEHENFMLKDVNLVSFLDYKDGYNNELISKYLDENVSPFIEREPQNASLIFNNEKVSEFIPSQNGIKIEKESFVNSLKQEIEKLEKSSEKTVTLRIPISTTTPDVSLNDVNNLGINELIGRGVSYFKGSISSRIFNIGHASKKFNSILIAPGETFSFNKILGDVSALTGYKQAYIIKDGRTVLGDGGGVCQVSTTLFRAALDAGLPIIERSAHSYRVGYYEQGSPPGIDATIFYPSTDFKFVNDTPGYLLIQSTYNPQKYSLVFEIYGTNDNRIATLTKPIISSSTPPPEDLYVDDPTLPNGQVKQIDHKAWGAKVSFSYKVEKNGQEIFNKVFISNYRPWQSVFLRGTGQ